MSHATEEQLKQQIKSVLDKSVDELGSDTRHQLQVRRTQVLAGETRSTTVLNWPVFGGVTALASVVLCAVFLLMTQPQHSVHENNTVSELDTLLFDEDMNMELYEQYDFYVWLSQHKAKG